MQRCESEVIYCKINHKGGSFLKPGIGKCYKQQIKKLELYLPERCSGSRGGIPGGTAGSRKPPGSQNGRGCLSVAEFPSIGAGKAAENSKSRHQLSARCCHKPQTTAWSANRSLSRVPGSNRTAARPPPPNCLPAASPGRSGAGEHRRSLLSLEIENEVPCLG